MDHVADDGCRAVIGGFDPCRHVNMEQRDSPHKDYATAVISLYFPAPAPHQEFAAIKGQ